MEENETLVRVINETLRRSSMLKEFSPEDFNAYVVTGRQAGPENPEARIGRVVQVRLEHGEWGSDTVFIRHRHGKIWTHENQAFWKVPDEFKSDLDKIFKDVELDPPGETYTVRGDEDPETGFIIASKIPEGESTPLRDVQEKLANVDPKLREMFHKIFGA